MQESRISDASYPRAWTLQQGSPPNPKGRSGLHHLRAHYSCRRLRAQHLSRMGSHLAEYRTKHDLAASLQARHPHLIIWTESELAPTGSPAPSASPKSPTPAR